MEGGVMIELPSGPPQGAMILTVWSCDRDPGTRDRCSAGGHWPSASWHDAPGRRSHHGSAIMIRRAAGIPAQAGAPGPAARATQAPTNPASQ
eukprot:768225-Hanusia_phi.AAC.1